MVWTFYHLLSPSPDYAYQALPLFSMQHRKAGNGPGDEASFSVLRFLWHSLRVSQIVFFLFFFLLAMLTRVQAMCFLLMRTTDIAYTGKGRQQHIHVHVDQCCPCSSQIFAYAAREVRALESSINSCDIANRHYIFCRC